ncbi:ABC transporter permease [Labrys sp. ZIDIC5]|uniref:ABC transporter permease n=1 Tax=Labrys sedimenti TaxID=3106036 RepID=UPI002ACA9E68|nr:ABC transporter permease [Labrys sp. ZIDIC5]MDZ5454664.1 ABC transporter permease [Labrys sp. ZIDIC5]
MEKGAVSGAEPGTGLTEPLPQGGGRLRRAAEFVAVPAFALLVAAALFSAMLLGMGQSPLAFFELLWRGAFGSAFSWQNTLQRAAPLILTALCVALPARAGLMVIGGEGAFVVGGLVAAIAPLPFLGLAPALVLLALMATAGMLAGALWVGLVGVLRYRRGVNETISSLLLTYIAVAVLSFLVEGPLRDPTTPNKPSTHPIGAEMMLAPIPGTSVHWGLVAGIVACVFAHLLINRTSTGFAIRIAGGNPRTALGQGLPVGKLIVLCCLLAGGAAGLAGFFEVATVHGAANVSLVAGYGFTGILVSFLARHNTLAIPPVAILFGGIGAAGGLIQRRLGLPDATVALLEGVIFVTLLTSETLYGRFALFQPRGARPGP